MIGRTVITLNKYQFCQFNFSLSKLFPRFVRTLFFYLFIFLGMMPINTEASVLSTIKVRSDNSFVSLSFTFDSVPQWSVRELDNPPRIELVLLKTSYTEIYDISMLPLPIKKLQRYFGGENTSISIHLVGKVLHFLRESEKEITFLFPKDLHERTTLKLSESLSLTIERIFDGERFLEIYNTFLSREEARKRLSIVSAVDLGAYRLTVTDIAKRSEALLAFNAGFFDQNGKPVGLLIIDGKLLALPAKGRRASLIIDKEGNAQILRPNLSFWLEVEGKRVRVDGFNQPMAQGKVLLYNHLFPRAKLQQDAIYFRVTGEALEPIAYESINNLPENAILLAETLSPEADPFKGKSSVRFKFSLTDQNGNLIDVRHAVEASPMLIENGQVSINTVIDEVSEDVIRGERARTAVGLDEDGNILIVVVKENKELGVKGFTLKELARKLIELGAITALNLDGGGSSIIAINGAPLNLAFSAQRKVPSAIIIK